MTFDLFTPISRDERQLESVKKWAKFKGRSTVVAGTGVGKTYIAMKAMKFLLKQHPEYKILVVVPTDALREQWVTTLDENGLGLNTDVQVMMGASQRECICDFLVIDEAHRINASTLSNIFNVVKYKYILGLTATFERLDGRHEILAKYAPVCDTITIEEAMLNGWVSKYRDYIVIVSVDDIETYKQYNKRFIESFEFFRYDFNLAMKMIGKNGLKNKLAYRDELCPNGSKEELSNVLKSITFHANNFIKSIQDRKKFVYNHPKKLEITKEIIKHRSDKKIITFSANTKMTESIGTGYIFTGKEGKKKNRITMAEFSAMPEGSVLNTVKLAEEGISLPDLSVGIMLGVNSSKTKQVQTLGRIIRLSKDKTAEFFTLVIEDTIETEWMKKSRSSNNYEIIDVENLYKLLRGEPYEPYRKKLKNYQFRF